MRSVIQRYPLVSFFVLAIGLTWIFMITDALGSHGFLPFRVPVPLMIVEGYMPTLAAIIVAGQTRGTEGVRALLRKLLIWRVGIGWYLFAVFGLLAVYLAAILIHNQFYQANPVPIWSAGTPPFRSPLELVPNVILLFLVTGVVNGEELAWRGFGLPRLQARYDALTASVILGVIWTVFHLPLFFTTTGSTQSDWSFVSFLVSTVAVSVLFTWMYNNTRGSVLLAYLLHASANTWTRIVSVDHAPEPLKWVTSALLAAAAAAVLAVSGPENLSRKGTRIQEG